MEIIDDIGILAGNFNYGNFLTLVTIPTIFLVTIWLCVI